MGKKNKKYKFKLSNVQNVDYKIDKSGDITLNLLEKDFDLPFVSVITITNRSNKFNLAIYNWLNFLYPENLIEWIIVDDTKEKNDIKEILEKLNDKRINYLYEKNINKIDDKRNFGVFKSKGDIIINMDDDDYHYKDSILAKVKCLIKYKKKCIFSRPIGQYNVINNTSQVLDNDDKTAPCIPEGTMAFYKSLWEKNKFKFSTNFAGEGMIMAWKKEKQILNIPYFFNCICFVHKNNTTSCRNLNIKNKDMSFLKFLPKEVIDIINNW